MSQDPEEIRREIEQTRQQLSSDVNALTESAKPGNIVRRRTEKVRGAAVSAKERVMGALPDVGSGSSDGPGVSGHAADLKDRASGAASGAASSASGAAHSAADAASGAASSVRDAASSSPQLVKQKAQGNPLAAGVIAFGVGWLVSSLLPATQREQQAAAAVKENAAPLAQEAKSAAQQVAENLREPAQQAVDSVKQTAADAVDHTKQEGQSSAQQVTSDAKDAAGTVQESRA